MCKNNADCGEDGEKCCFNGCQRDCVKFGKSLDAADFTVQKLLHTQGKVCIRANFGPSGRSLSRSL